VEFTPNQEVVASSNDH